MCSREERAISVGKPPDGSFVRLEPSWTHSADMFECLLSQLANGDERWLAPITPARKA